MFLFKDNYTLFVSDIDKSVKFYQDAFNMHMYELSSDGNEVIMESELDGKLLTLIYMPKHEPSSISIYASEISSAYNLHFSQGIIDTTQPLNAIYTVHDPDINTINVIAELENISIESYPNNNATDDDQLDEIE